MKLAEYISNVDNELAIVLDSNGDNLYLFDKVFSFINEKMNPTECKYQPAFFDGGSGYFIKDGIKVKIICSNWLGIEVRLPESSLPDEIEKVREWAQEIYKGMHSLDFLGRGSADDDGFHVK